MNTKELIGLEVCRAAELLKELGANFKFVYCTDRKQTQYDKEIVTAVRTDRLGNLTLVVCRYQFEVQ